MSKNNFNWTLYKAEEKTRSYYRKHLRNIFKLNQRLYKLNIKLFELIDSSGPFENDREKAMSILVTRSIENLRTVTFLIKTGYLSQAASIAVNTIEIFLQNRFIKDDEKRAQKWLNHTKDFMCWRITGKNGLCQKLKMKDIEMHYKELCSIKHTQSKSKHLNYINLEKSVIIRIAPLRDKEIAKQINNYSFTSSYYAILDYSVFENGINRFPAKDYQIWINSMDILRKEYKNNARF